MASNSFGGSIKLTGESEYRKALKDIGSDLRLMSSEMKVLATSTDKSGKASDADRAKKEALGKAIGEQRQKLDALNKALADSVAKNGASSDATKRLQTQVNNATSNLNKMESQLNGTGDGLEATSKKASVFGDVLKANLASEAIIGGIKAIGGAVKQMSGAFVDLVGDSVKAYADYEQLVGGVETLFGKSAGKVQQYATEAYKTAGLSANQYMEQATSFSATLLQGLGGDTAKASEYANQAIIDMSDNANKMGTDITMIQNAYQGFAKDNYTMLDNLKLGYGGTASEMARLVNDSGVLGEGVKVTAESVKDIPFDQIISAIHKTQDGLGITGTTAKEASETISGSFNSVKSAWENVLVSFGSDEIEVVEEAIKALVDSAMNLVNNVVDLLPLVIDGIGMLAEGLVARLPEILSQLIPSLQGIFTMLIETISTTLPTIIPIAIQLITTLATALLQNLPLILQAGVDTLLALVNGITQALPTLIPAIVEAIKVILDVLVKNLPLIITAGIELLIALVEGLAKALPQLISYIPQIISTLVNVLTQPAMISRLLQASLTIILALAKGLIQSIPQIVGAVPQIIGAIINGIRNMISGFASVGGDMINGLVNGFKGGIGRAKDAIIAGAKQMLGKLASFLGINSPSRYMRDHFGKHMASGIGVGFDDEMTSVSKDMQKSIADKLPTSIDTDVNLNSSDLASVTAESTSLARAFDNDKLVSAMQTAFKGVKIELDDKEVGNFVIGTVERAVF